MARTSPIADLHHRAAAHLLPYGPGDAPIGVVGTYGVVPIEYAAIRKAAALVDEPQRGLIEITGADRAAFLDRMLTQELKKGFGPFDAKRSFWLNKKGRIDADLRLVNLPDKILADVDVFAAPGAARTLGAYVITEDVQIADVSEQHHRLSLHGPGACAALARVSTHLQGDAIETLAPGRAGVVSIAGVRAVVDRQDTTGEIGLHVCVPVEGALRVYEALVALAHVHEPGHANARPLLTPAGWLALNIARLEAGTPMYNIDFGSDCLPAETGVLDDRVSFTKGCYLGQEIVARMHALGQPKQRLVALRLLPSASASATGNDELPPLPMGGAPVYTSDEPGAEPVGAVTSSTIAPMLSRIAIALAMVKFKHAGAGTRLYVRADEHLVPAQVHDGLAQVKR